ncbi:MAG: Gfo/Idh/MocA family oxidoreductase [Prevotellaceae bacterium]|jgi:predicted dehydrogenase|nr:Gfo/Idh/MocA family oxidoreductase [Prevotellaceae bacterium]
MKPIKVVFIGAGWVCANRHIPAFAALKNVTLWGIIDAYEEKAKNTARKWKMPHYAAINNIEGIGWFADADAVVVTTPPVTHYEWIRQSLLAGKHVLTEKPFSTKREHGQALLDLAKARNLQLCVVHNNLYTRAQKKLRQWIAKGKLGEITGLSISLLNNPNRHLPGWYDDLPCGLLFDELSHFLYTAASLTTNLRAHAAEMYVSRCGLKNTPSKARITLLSDHFPLFFSLDFEAPVCEWHVTIQGTKGAANVDVFRDILMFVPSDGKHTLKDHFRTVANFLWDTSMGFAKTGVAYMTGSLSYGMRDIAKCFIQCLKNNINPEHYISGEFGVRIFNLLCDVVEMLEKNKDTATFSLQLPTPELGTQ